MKDLLVMLVEYIFDSGQNEVANLKGLLLLVLKVFIFILILSFILWLLLK